MRQVHFNRCIRPVANPVPLEISLRADRLNHMYRMGLLFVLAIGTLVAQEHLSPGGLTGTWVYRLGPRTLFALHLEPAADPTDQPHGYLLLPEKFLMNPGPHFSGIVGPGRRELVSSIGREGGCLQLLEDNPTAKADQRDHYQVCRLDRTHVAFTLFKNMAPLNMEAEANPPTIPSEWDSARTYSPDDFLPDNSRMTAIVAADQADRSTDQIDWTVVGKVDARRRAESAMLLKLGELHTGTDFGNAALVFQHGNDPNDYLLAHVLAVVAISKGQSSAIWLSSATLDRYLESIKQPQIFGTQFTTLGSQPTTQEPYDRTLISDVLRAYMAVPSLADQDKQRRQYDEQRGIRKSVK